MGNLLDINVIGYKRKENNMKTRADFDNTRAELNSVIDLFDDLDMYDYEGVGDAMNKLNYVRDFLYECAQEAEEVELKLDVLFEKMREANDIKQEQVKGV